MSGSQHITSDAEAISERFNSDFEKRIKDAERRFRRQEKPSIPELKEMYAKGDLSILEFEERVAKRLEELE